MPVLGSIPSSSNSMKEADKAVLNKDNKKNQIPFRRGDTSIYKNHKIL
jgi:hypothetical protein